MPGQKREARLRARCPGHPRLQELPQKDVDGRDEPGHDVEKEHVPNSYSITAWSGACACLRKAALLEPIMSASGIAHRVNSITIW
jgi:hypothetical protein